MDEPEKTVIVHEDRGGGGGAAVAIVVLVLIALVVLFFLFGGQGMFSGNAPTKDIKATVDINVPKTN